MAASDKDTNKDESKPNALTKLAAEAKDRIQEGAKKIAGPLALTLLMVVVLGATVAGIVVGLKELKETDTFLPEIGLTMVLVVSVIGLLTVLSLLASVFGLLGMNDKQQPLALPPGSVQAIIAISLILIFAIMSVHLHGQAGGEVEELEGVTAAQLADIPAEEIIDQDQVTENGEVTFAVSLRISNEAAEDLRTQLLTTISTLVVAVAGFYFGSKTVTEGAKSLEQAVATAQATTDSAPSLSEGEKAEAAATEAEAEAAAARVRAKAAGKQAAAARAAVKQTPE